MWAGRRGAHVDSNTTLQQSCTGWFSFDPRLCSLQARPVPIQLHGQTGAVSESLLQPCALCPAGDPAARPSPHMHLGDIKRTKTYLIVSQLQLTIFLGGLFPCQKPLNPSKSRLGRWMGLNYPFKSDKTSKFRLFFSPQVQHHEVRPHGAFHHRGMTLSPVELAHCEHTQTHTCLFSFWGIGKATLSSN